MNLYHSVRRKSVLTLLRNSPKVCPPCSSATRISRRTYGAGHEAVSPEQEAGAGIDSREDGKRPVDS